MTEQERKQIAKLIRSIAEGDASATSEIYNKMKYIMFALAYNVTNDKADAEDIVHDALLKIVTRAETFKKNTNGVAWIATIVKNTAIDYYRVRKNMKDKLEMEMPEIFEFDDDFITVREMIEHLTPEEKHFVELYYYMGYSYSEIEGMLGIPKSTVKYRVDRIIEKLKKIYKK